MKICQKCGNENGDNAKFCIECGEKLQVSPKICPECGTELVNQPKFCPECGNKILLDKNISDDEIEPINSGVKATIELCMIDIPGTQFSMLETPVTQELYKKVMGYNPSVFSNENSIGNLGNFLGSFFENKKTSETTENIEDCKRPVENISQLDAFIFCNELSLLKGKKPCYSINGTADTKKWPFKAGSGDFYFGTIQCDCDNSGYRLPTDNEWTYAAKGGENFKHAGGQKMKNVGWYTGNSDEKTHPVKQKIPNGYGLYDMNGNVWEWICEKRRAYGGSWKDGKDCWSPTTCDSFMENQGYDDVGFRVVSGPEFKPSSYNSLYTPLSDGIVFTSWGDEYISNDEDWYKNDINQSDYAEQDICCLQNNSISIKEKKDKIHQMVLQYASQIGEKCVDWKVKNYETFPNDKKDLLLKIDCNFNYDDFATIFSIPNPLKIQLSAKFDYGIIFTIFGFYIRTVEQLNSYTFVKYSEIVNCEAIKNEHIKIYLSTEIKGLFNSSENFIECGEYLAKPLSELLMKLKDLDDEFSTDYLTSVTSVRTDGLKTSRDRKYFMKGQINGYIRCSREYEMKLRKQADLFLTTTNKWRKERAEYEALLDEYDATIVELEAKLSESESPEYRRRLNNVVNYRDQLASLSY